MDKPAYAIFCVSAFKPKFRLKGVKFSALKRYLEDR